MCQTACLKRAQRFAGGEKKNKKNSILFEFFEPLCDQNATQMLLKISFNILVSELHGVSFVLL